MARAAAASGVMAKSNTNEGDILAVGEGAAMVGFGDERGVLTSGPVVGRMMV